MPKRLGNIFSNLDGDFFSVIKNANLLSLWVEIVDDKIKNNTEPVKITNRTLYISTASPAWAQELNFLKPDIIRKFNQKAGEEAISDIRFKTAGGF